MTRQERIALAAEKYVRQRDLVASLRAKMEPCERVARIVGGKLIAAARENSDGKECYRSIVDHDGPWGEPTWLYEDSGEMCDACQRTRASGVVNLYHAEKKKLGGLMSAVFRAAREG